MQQAEIIATLAEEEDCSKAVVRRMLARLRELLITDLKETGRAEIHGVGVFKVSHRAARQGYSIKRRCMVTVPARKTVYCRVSSALKSAVMEESVNDAE